MKTVTQFIKELQKIAETNPRAYVLVEWQSFESDDHTHEHIGKIEVEMINYDDGSGSTRKDGTEKMSTVVTLSGRLA